MRIIVSGLWQSELFLRLAARRTESSRDSPAGRLGLLQMTPAAASHSSSRFLRRALAISALTAAALRAAPPSAGTTLSAKRRVAPQLSCVRDGCALGQRLLYPLDDAAEAAALRQIDHRCHLSHNRPMDRAMSFGAFQFCLPIQCGASCWYRDCPTVGPDPRSDECGVLI
jgi:hypothetical protein